MAPRKPEPDEMSEAAEIELELKRLQIQQARITIEQHNQKIEDMKADNARRILDQKALEMAREKRKRVCRHRKGGRNNNFARGNAPDYALAANTYPDGTVIIMCTRCQSEWKKPDKALRKSNPKLYAEQMAEFKKMAELPTDNSPSGSQIFLIEKVA